MVVDELIAILGYDIRGEADLKRFNKGLDDAADALRGLVKYASAAAAALAGAFGNSVIQTSAEFEKMTATLTSIEGSSAKAEAAMDWVADFAKTTPYELGQVSEAFVKLRAYGLDPMDGTLRSIGDAASAMGKDVIAGVEAIADASTGENERLKEFGITSEKMGKKVAYHWTQNGVAMSKTLNATSTEIVKFLRENFDQRFGGAMDEQSKTWNGMWGNMMDTWTEFKKMVGDKGFFDTMKGYLGGFLDYFAQLKASGVVSEWAQTISDAMVKGVDATINFVQRMKLNLDTFLELAEEYKGAWTGIKIVLGGLAVALFPITSGLIAAGLALDDFLTYMRGGESVIGRFIDKMNAMIEESGGIGMALAHAIWEGFKIEWGLVSRGASIVFDALKDQILEIDWKGVGVSMMTAIWDGMKSIAESLKEWIKGLIPDLSFLAPIALPVPAGQGASLAIGNASANLAKMAPGKVANSGIGPSAAMSMTNSGNVTTTVNQTVTQAVDAPSAAARATASAVGGTPARITQGGF